MTAVVLRVAQSAEPRAGRTAFVDKTERRQRLLNHARDVFARRGYHATKIEDIVSAAGVARGTFYLYFEDKRTVFEEIVDRTLARIAMAILRVDPQDSARSVADQVRENIRRIVRILLDDRATTKILHTGALGVDEAFDRKLHSFTDEIAKLLDESLADGQALGLIVPGDVSLLACMTLGSLKELLYQLVLREWAMPEEVVVNSLFAFLEGGLLRMRLS